MRKNLTKWFKGYFMIITFEFNNFRSAKKDCFIDFRKANMSQHKESLIANEYLPVTVIYGPNGGGKSTIVLALGYLINLVIAPIHQIRGEMLPKQTFKPFLLDSDSKNKPSEFRITFCLNECYQNQYRYYIKVFGGRILEETLFEKENDDTATPLFNRNEKGVELNDKFKDMIVSPELNPTIPYLSLCAIMFPQTELGKIGTWFDNVLMVDFGNPGTELFLPQFLSKVSEQPSIKKLINRLLSGMKLIDEYELVSDSSNGVQNKKIKTYHNVFNETYNLFYDDESMGTKKMMQIAPSLALALQLGNVLVVDELDAKLHPKMLEYIISMFTDKTINTHGAQLIFTSHDMYTLSSKVFRRDEIYFACKNEDASTVVYSLADIKDEDNRMSRPDLSFSKKYLEGKYGSDPYFTKMKLWEDCPDA